MSEKIPVLFESTSERCLTIHLNVGAQQLVGVDGGFVGSAFEGIVGVDLLLSSLSGQYSVTLTVGELFNVETIAPQVLLALADGLVCDLADLQIGVAPNPYFSEFAWLMAWDAAILMEWERDQQTQIDELNGRANALKSCLLGVEENIAWSTPTITCMERKQKDARRQQNDAKMAIRAICTKNRINYKKLITLTGSLKDAQGTMNSVAHHLPRYRQQRDEWNERAEELHGQINELTDQIRALEQLDPPQVAMTLLN